MKKNNKALIPALIICAIVGSGIWWWVSSNASSTKETSNNTARSGQGAGGYKGRGKAAMPPVQVAPTQHQDMVRYLSGLGTVTAASTIAVVNQVSGELIAIHFTEGEQVKAGQLLAEIDPRPFQLQLAQAKGTLAKDQATLTAAQQTLVRYQKLIKDKLISQQEYDTQLSLVRQSEGAVQTDQANVSNALLQLDYARITAPIDGLAGLRHVDRGNYLPVNTSIVTLAQTHPIDVLFTLSEDVLPEVVQAQKQGKVTVEAWNKDGTLPLSSGYLLSMDNQIDPTTGTIKLRAKFDNTDNSLFPNQFVNIKLKASTVTDALVIPDAAVQMGNEGHFVWRVDNNNKVTKHRVTVGIKQDDKTQIINGLTSDSRVVTDGIDRLTNDMQVEILQVDKSASAGSADSNENKRQKPHQSQGNN